MGGVLSFIKKKKKVPKFLRTEDDHDESQGNVIRALEEMATEYMTLPILLHPVKSDGIKEKKEKCESLQEQKACLSDSEKKVDYVKGKNSDIGLSYKEWVEMKKHLKQTMHWSQTSGPSLVKVRVTETRRESSEEGASWESDALGKVITIFRNTEI